MRLSEESQEIIRETVEEIFGHQAKVMVFGSRLDDTKRGGDIDLLIQVDETSPEDRRKSLNLAARLQLRLGDQPIDVLLMSPETIRTPILVEALRTGVQL